MPAFLEKTGVVPVVVLQRAEDAVESARALLAGGIGAMEITLRTPAALEAIARVAAQVPEMVVGAGTVLHLEQLRQALDAGAQFLVSPGSDPQLLAHAQAQGISLLPGVVSPSEIMLGYRHGIRVFKFFPAAAYGGVATLQALAGPFGDVAFVPTGGVGPGNLRQYLSCGCVRAVGGSWMITADMLDRRAFGEITEKSREAMAIYHEIRGANT